MKKLQSSLAAKAVAAIVLVAALLVAAAAVAGTVVLVGNDSYLYNSTRIQTSLLSNVVYNAAGDLQPLMATLANGQSDWPGYDATLSYYQDEFSADKTNLCILITDRNGKTLFQNRDYANYLPETELVRDWSFETGQTYHERTYKFDSYAQMDDMLNSLQEQLVSFDYDEDSETGKITVTVTTLWTQLTTLTLRVAVFLDMQADDACLRAVNLASRLNSLRDFLVPIAIISLCVTLVMFIFLLCAAEHKAGAEGIHLNWADKIPFDLYLAFIVALCVLLAWVTSEAQLIFSQTLFIVLLCATVPMMLLLGLAPVLSFATRAKVGKWWKNTVIFYVLRLIWRVLGKLGRGIAYLCRHLPLVWKTALCCVGVCLLELLFLLMGVEGEVYWFIEKLLLVPLVLLAAVNLRVLQKGGEAIAEGNMDYRVSTRAMLPDFRRHAENLNSIGSGMQKAVEVQMRSERMKAELITNVSHDIKTPLTSIVNYVDLLKTAGLTSEHAPEYLEVLDRQSARLKKLTEDLVEASKASTGSIAVHAERTNVNVLLAQAAGEYEERLHARGLEPVLEFKLREAYIWADGRLLWRVLDNLLSNICKYSLEHTRVYIQAEECDGRLHVTFKNISRDALNVPAEELMERFVRGDASRSAEGSGLGLSIARSLTELQGGQFALHIDGDLFKAELTFPLLPAEA